METVCSVICVVVRVAASCHMRTVRVRTVYVRRVEMSRARTVQYDTGCDQATADKLRVAR